MTTTVAATALIALGILGHLNVLTLPPVGGYVCFALGGSFALGAGISSAFLIHQATAKQVIPSKVEGFHKSIYTLLKEKLAEHANKPEQEQ